MRKLDQTVGATAPLRVRQTRNLDKLQQVYRRQHADEERKESEQDRYEEEFQRMMKTTTEEEESAIVNQIIDQARASGGSEHLPQFKLALLNAFDLYNDKHRMEREQASRVYRRLINFEKQANLEPDRASASANGMEKISKGLKSARASTASKPRKKSSERGTRTNRSKSREKIPSSSKPSMSSLQRFSNQSKSLRNAKIESSEGVSKDISSLCSTFISKTEDTRRELSTLQYSTTLLDTSLGKLGKPTKVKKEKPPRSSRAPQLSGISTTCAKETSSRNPATELLQAIKSQREASGKGRQEFLSSYEKRKELLAGHRARDGSARESSAKKITKVAQLSQRKVDQLSEENRNLQKELRAQKDKVKRLTQRRDDALKEYDARSKQSWQDLLDQQQSRRGSHQESQTIDHNEANYFSFVPQQPLRSHRQSTFNTEPDEPVKEKALAWNASSTNHPMASQNYRTHQASQLPPRHNFRPDKAREGNGPLDTRLPSEIGFDERRFSGQSSSNLGKRQELPHLGAYRAKVQNHFEDEEADEEDSEVTAKLRATEKQYLIMQQIKIFRELKKHTRKQREHAGRALKFLLRSQDEMKMAVIDLLQQHAAAHRIERLQFEKADEHRNFLLLTRGLAALRAFREHSHQKQVAENFQLFSAQPKLVLSIFSSWRQFAKESKMEKRAAAFQESTLLRGGFCSLRTYATSEKVAREKWAIACSVHGQTVGDKVLQVLREFSMKRRLHRLQGELFRHQKLSQKVILGLKEVSEVCTAASPLLHRGQLRCLLAWAPKTGSLDLLNIAMRRSEQDKYRAFQRETEKFIATCMKKQAFAKLAQAIQFRRRRNQVEKRRLFSLWKDEFEVRAKGRAVAGSLMKKRDARALQKCWGRLRVYARRMRTVRASGVEVSNRHQFRVVAGSFDNWVAKFVEADRLRRARRKVEERRIERIKDQVLVLWTTRLKMKTKTRQLYSKQFKQVQELVASRYWRQWRKKAKKAAYLEEQYSSIQKYQDHELVMSTFNKMKQYRSYRMRKQSQYQNMRQLYIYNLGRRIFNSLHTYARSHKVKKEYFKVLDQDRNLKVLYAVFKELESYAIKKRTAKIKQFLKQREVDVALRKYYLRTWKKQMKKRQAVKLMEYGFDIMRSRQALRRLAKYRTFVEENAAVITANREPFLLLQTLKAVARLISKKKMASVHYEQQVLVSQKEIAKRAWKRMRAKHEQSLKAFKLADWTIIQIARAFKQRYFDQIKANAHHQKIKRVAPRLYETNLLQRALFCLTTYSLKKQRLRQTSAIIQEARRKRKVEASWSLWMSQVETLTAARSFSKDLEMRMMFRVLLHLKHYASVKRQRNYLFRALTSEFILSKKQRALTKLFFISSVEHDFKASLDAARAHHQANSLRAIVQTWRSLTKKMKPLRLASQLCQEATSVRAKALFMKAWVKASWKSMNRLNGQSQLRSLLERQAMKAAVIQWRSSVTELNDLNTRARTFRTMKDSALVRLIFTAIQEFRLEKQTNRERGLYVKEFQEHNTLAKGFQGMKWYFGYRQEKRDFKEFADTHFIYKFQSKIFKSLARRTEQSGKIRAATEEFNRRKIRKAFPKFFRGVSLLCQERLADEHDIAKADALYRASLITTSFHAMISYTSSRLELKYKIEQAQEFKKNRLKMQAFTALISYWAKRKEKTEKRKVLFAVVAAFDAKNTKEVAFNSIFQFVIEQSFASQQARSHVVRGQKARIFSTIKAFTKKQRDSRERFGIIRSNYEVALRVRCFSAWRQNILKIRLSEEHFRSVELRRAGRILEVLRMRVEKKKARAEVIKMFKTIQLGVYFRAFESQVAFERVHLRRLNNLVQRRELAAKKRVLDALTKYFLREKAAAIINSQGRLRRVSSMFKSWRQRAAARVFFKVKLQWVLGQRQSLDKKRRFMTWKKLTFFSLMMARLTTGLELTEEHQARKAEETKTGVISALKWHCALKKKQKMVSAKVQDNSRLVAQTLQGWKTASRGTLLSLRMTRVLERRMRSHFQQVQEFSAKEARLLQVEAAFNHSSRTKGAVLRQWVFLTAANQNIREFQRVWNLQKKMVVIEQLMAYAQKQQDKALVKHNVITHFSNQRPQVLHAFMKAFLKLNWKAQVDRVRQEANDAVSDTTSVFGATVEVHTPVCQTALAKYILDKWKLAIPRMIKKNRQLRLSAAFYERSTKQKVFRELQNFFVRKQMIGQIQENCQRISEERLARKAFVALLAHCESKQDGRQLKVIGAELKQIKEQQLAQRLLCHWYEAMVAREQRGESEKEDNRANRLALEFRRFKQEERLQRYFYVLTDYAKMAKKKREIKASLQIRTHSVYEQRLKKRVLQAMASLRKPKRDLSRLYALFQAWKFQVKESALRKRYMDDSMTMFSANLGNFGNFSQLSAVDKWQDEEDKHAKSVEMSMRQSLGKSMSESYTSQNYPTDQDSSYPDMEDEGRKEERKFEDLTVSFRRRV